MQQQDKFLKEVFETQYEFTNKIFNEKFNIDISTLSKDERTKWIKEFILSGAKEFMEMLDEISWKQHVDQTADGNNFLEEGIDAFKFLVNCLIIAGYSYEEFVLKYREKSFIVNFRYEQQKKMRVINEETKVAFIDIDGILNHYPKEFIEFVNEKNRFIAVDTIIYNTINEIKSANYARYKKLKHEFRLQGFEATKSVVRNEAVDFIKRLKEKGYVVVLLTARPYKKYNRLFFDTVQWLKENYIQYDLIFFEREKAKFTLDNFSNCKRSIFVDDDIENINRLANYIETPILFENLSLHNEDDYNNVNKKVITIKSLDLAQYLIQ